MKEDDALISENYLVNMKNLTKIGEKMKEKFNNMFKKGINSNKNKDEGVSRTTLNKNPADNSNKNMFTIEEDEDHKVYYYNLDNEDDYDDEYIEEELDEENDKNIKDINSGIKSSPNNNISPLHRNEDKNIEPKQNIIPPEPNESSHIPIATDKSIYETEKQTQSHRIYSKGSLIDLEGLSFVKCFKMKKKNKIFSLIGIGKERVKEENYIVLLDENLLYAIKDIIADKLQPLLRIAGGHYDLRNLCNIDIKNLEKGRALISLVFVLNKDVDNYQSKIKELYFENAEAHVFYDCLKSYITNLKIPLILNNQN